MDQRTDKPEPSGASGNDGPIPIALSTPTRTRSSDTDRQDDGTATATRTPLNRTRSMHEGKGTPSYLRSTRASEARERITHGSVSMGSASGVRKKPTKVQRSGVNVLTDIFKLPQAETPVSAHPWDHAHGVPHARHQSGQQRSREELERLIRDELDQPSHGELRPQSQDELSAAHSARPRSVDETEAPQGEELQAQGHIEAQVEIQAEIQEKVTQERVTQETQVIDNRARLYKHMFLEGCKAYDEGRFSSARETCLWLLSKPALPRFTHVQTLHLLGGVTPKHQSQRCLEEALALCDEMDSIEPGHSVDRLREKTMEHLKFLESVEDEKSDEEDTETDDDDEAEMEEDDMHQSAEDIQEYDDREDVDMGGVEGNEPQLESYFEDVEALRDVEAEEAEQWEEDLQIAWDFAREQARLRRQAAQAEGADAGLEEVDDHLRNAANTELPATPESEKGAEM